jgi:tetratricopeptide (TPR) repeat protein
VLSLPSNSPRVKSDLSLTTHNSEILETSSNCPTNRNYIPFFCLLRTKLKSSLVSTYRFLSVILVLFSFNSYAQKVCAQALLPYTPELSSEYLDPYGAELLQDAVQLIRFREFDLALSRAKLASQLSPNHYETWFILGTLYVQQGNIEEGVSALEKAKELAPEEAEVLFALGNSYFQLGEYNNAAKELQAGLKINSEVPQAYFDLGNSYLKLNQYQKSITAYEKAVKLEDSFWPAINNIGLVEYEQGKRASAIEKWRKALKIDEKQAEPMLAIAVALYTEGKADEGIKLGKQALELDNSYGNLKFLEDNLWGEKLLNDTAKFFQDPAIKVMIKTETEATSKPE